VRTLLVALETLDVSVRSYRGHLWYRLATVGALTADAVVHPDLREFWFLQSGAEPS